MHLGESIFRSHQTPYICKQQFEVCDDCVLGWVSFPNNRIYRMSRSSLTNVSREPIPQSPLSPVPAPQAHKTVMASQVEVPVNMGLCPPPSSTAECCSGRQIHKSTVGARSILGISAIAVSSRGGQLQPGFGFIFMWNLVP